VQSQRVPRPKTANATKVSQVRSPTEESVLHAPLIQVHHKTLSMIEIANVTKVILETTGMDAKYVLRELTRVQRDHYHALAKSSTAKGAIANACLDCSAGKCYGSVGGDLETQCVACPVGKSTENLSGRTSISHCKQCNAGTYADVIGRATCKLCAYDTFSSALGAISIGTCEQCTRFLWRAQINAQHVQRENIKITKDNQSLSRM